MKWLNQSSLHEEFILENPHSDLYDKCYFFASKKKYPKVFTMTDMYKFYKQANMYSYLTSTNNCFKCKSYQM